MRLELALIVGILFFCSWCAYIVARMNASVSPGGGDQLVRQTEWTTAGAAAGAANSSSVAPPAGEYQLPVNRSQADSNYLIGQQLNQVQPDHLVSTTNNHVNPYNHHHSAFEASEPRARYYGQQQPQSQQQAGPPYASFATNQALAPNYYQSSNSNLEPSFVQHQQHQQLPFQQANNNAQMAAGAGGQQWQAYALPTSLTPVKQQQQQQQGTEFGPAGEQLHDVNTNEPPDYETNAGEDLATLGNYAGGQQQQRLQHAADQEVGPDDDQDGDQEQQLDQEEGEDEGNSNGGDDDNNTNNSNDYSEDEEVPSRSELKQLAQRRSFSEQDSNSNERDKDGRLIVTKRRHLINGKPVAVIERHQNDIGNESGGDDDYEADPNSDNEDKTSSDATSSLPREQNDDFERLVSEIDQEDRLKKQASARQRRRTDQAAGQPNQEQQQHEESRQHSSSKLFAGAAGAVAPTSKPINSNARYRRRFNPLIVSAGTRPIVAVNSRVNDAILAGNKSRSRSGSRSRGRKMDKTKDGASGDNLNEHRLKETLTQQQWDDDSSSTINERPRKFASSAQEDEPEQGQEKGSEDEDQQQEQQVSNVVDQDEEARQLEAMANELLLDPKFAELSRRRRQADDTKEDEEEEQETVATPAADNIVSADDNAKQNWGRHRPGLNGNALKAEVEEGQDRHDEDHDEDHEAKAELVEEQNGSEREAKDSNKTNDLGVDKATTTTTTTTTTTERARDDTAQLLNGSPHRDSIVSNSITGADHNQTQAQTRAQAAQEISKAALVAVQSTGGDYKSADLPGHLTGTGATQRDRGGGGGGGGAGLEETRRQWHSLPDVNLNGLQDGGQTFGGASGKLTTLGLETNGTHELAASLVSKRELDKKSSAPGRELLQDFDSTKRKHANATTQPEGEEGEGEEALAVQSELLEANREVANEFVGQNKLPGQVKQVTSNLDNRQKVEKQQQQQRERYYDQLTIGRAERPTVIRSVVGESAATSLVPDWQAPLSKLPESEPIRNRSSASAPVSLASPLAVIQDGEIVSGQEDMHVEILAKAPPAIGANAMPQVLTNYSSPPPRTPAQRQLYSSRPATATTNGNNNGQPSGHGSSFPQVSSPFASGSSKVAKKKHFKRLEKKRSKLVNSKYKAARAYANKRKSKQKQGQMRKKKRKLEKKLIANKKHFVGSNRGHKYAKGRALKGANKGSKYFKDKGYKKRGFKKAYHKLETGDHKTYFDEFRDKDHNDKWKKFDDKHKYSSSKKWAGNDLKHLRHHKLKEARGKALKSGKWSEKAKSEHMKSANKYKKGKKMATKSLLVSGKKKSKKKKRKKKKQKQKN